LFLGTPAENNADRDAKGRHRAGSQRNPARGERIGNAKLTAEKVREIRVLYAAGGVSQAALGSRFGVNQSKISDVVHKKTWAHVI
jgi:predicted XRE-type DNA-binding protein